MSFKLCSILELPQKATNNETADRGEGVEEKVISFAHIIEDNFMLVLLLSSNGNLAIYYNISSSSRCEFMPISKLFPRQKLISKPALVVLTEDASVVVIVLADSNTFLLIPIVSLMDVTWGRRPTPLATKPTMFSMMNSEADMSADENNHRENVPCSAICYHSPVSQRTYLLFGNTAGALFLVDLHLKRICLRMDLKMGIHALMVYNGGGGNGQDGQKQLLISHDHQSSSQLVLPLESKDMQIRETLSRISSKDVFMLDEQFQHFPQSSNASMCILERHTDSLKICKSFNFTRQSALQPEQPTIKLDHFPVNTRVQQLLVTSHLVILLTSKNKLLVHFRFLQPNYEHAKFLPHQVDTNSIRIIGLVPPNNSSPLFSSEKEGGAPNEIAGNGAENRQQLLDILLVTENGLYWLRAERSIHGFILDHLFDQMYSTESLLTIAQCLQTNAISLCLSLLRTLLSQLSTTQQDNEKITAQIHGLLSIALSNNIQPELLLSLLQEYGQTSLLIPFLTLKCERNPTDSPLRQLLLTAMLAKLSQLTRGKKEMGGGGEKERDKTADNDDEVGPKKEGDAELETIEFELRNFLIRFGMCGQEILPILLRTHLWSCVFILLSRDPQEHSATIVRFLLELAAWRNVRRLDGMLLCLKFLHWHSLESYTPTLIIKLYNLVPSLSVRQLGAVEAIANTFLSRSVDCALSLKLAVSMRLLGLHGHSKHPPPTGESPAAPAINRLMAYRPLACGPNCTILLVENGIGYCARGGEGGNELDQPDRRPIFWGEFAAGTARMIKNGGGDQEDGGAAGMPSGSSKRRGGEAAAEPIKRSQSVRATKRRGEDGDFPLVSVPMIVQAPDERVQIHSVAAGTEHLLLLSSDGRLFSFGRNRFGQCGTGDNGRQQNLKEIHGEWGKVVQIRAGHYHSALITENDEVWLWGWGLYGQLGNGEIRNMLLPTKSVDFNKLGPIKEICLGYAHTLVLTKDGRVFGAGALAYGQLGVDPANLEGTPQKRARPIQLHFPAPIALLASAYFHGCALASNGDMFEWGECPQSLKMRMFLQKRLRAKEKQQQQQQTEPKKEKAQKDSTKIDSKIINGQEEQQQLGMEGQSLLLEQQEETDESADAEVVDEAIGTNLPPPSQKAATIIDMPRHHLHIRRLCKWNGAPIKSLSAGFNHSALLTHDGELYTWGKSLEMQLGHGDRKEKAQPACVEEPKNVKWADVVCARNFTLALSAEGLVFVWGRNDRNQLGLGMVHQQKKAPIRRILLKTEKGKAQRAVELPPDNCVEKPTMLPGLKVPMEIEQAPPNEDTISALLCSADQQSINSLSRFLTRYPVAAFIAIQAHLMAGDLLPAIRSLTALAQREGLLEPGVEPGHAMDAAERQIAIISRISQHCDGNATEMGNGAAEAGGGRTGMLKTSGDDNINSDKNGAGKPRRVSVHLRRTYHCSASSPAQPIVTTSSSHSAPGAEQKRQQQIGAGQQQNGKQHQLSTSSPTTSSMPTAAVANTAATANNNRSPSPQALDQKPIEKFYSLIDRIWTLLRVHPIREVQTLAIVELLHGRFPIFNRLAADLRLCRLVDTFLQLPPAVEAAGHGQRRFLELSVRERQSALRKAPRPDIGNRRFHSLKNRCEQLLAQDRFRYFNDCGHFEKCIVESGSIHSELAQMRNRMRRCTRCVSSSGNNSSSSSTRRSAGDGGGASQ